ncbi:MAG: carbohydrate kinase [Alphaproteobacteria bacterium]|nr:carbohydrate kinase [Alphaproteobacteria bacterium]
MKKPHIAGIGEVLYDILPDSRKLGGAPSDFLCYAEKHGADVSLISAIGADDLGREVVSELNKFNINPVLAVTPYPTGRVLIFKNGDSCVAHILENAAWDYIPYTNAAEECVKKADAIYFGTLALRRSYSMSTILDLIDEATKAVYKFFDINLRQTYYSKDIILKLLERANILRLNSEELKVLKNMLGYKGSNEDICLKIKEDFELLYLILGDTAKESKIWGPNGEYSAIKNSRLHQTFAFGAGNAFAGTFLSSILNGKTLRDAHEEANLSAIEVCKQTAGVY